MNRDDYKKCTSIVLKNLRDACPSLCKIYYCEKRLFNNLFVVIFVQITLRQVTLRTELVQLIGPTSVCFFFLLHVLLLLKDDGTFSDGTLVIGDETFTASYVYSVKSSVRTAKAITYIGVGKNK